MPKKTNAHDDTPDPIEIGSPLETPDQIEAPTPPRRKLEDHDKTPVVETIDRTPGKRVAELKALLDEANSEIGRLRAGFEGAVGSLTDIAAALEHEGDALDDATCSEAPDDCVRCLAEAGVKAANAVLYSRAA